MWERGISVLAPVGNPHTSCCSRSSVSTHPPEAFTAISLTAAAPGAAGWGEGRHGHYQSVLDKLTFFFSKAWICPVNTLGFILQTYLDVNLRR